MKSNIRPIVLLFSSITLIALALWLRPRLLAWYQHQRASQLLEKALQTDASTDPEATPCTGIAVQDPTARSQLDSARDLLDSAISNNPKLYDSYLVLGRVYCWLGEPGEAAQHYQSYTAMRPHNPMGQLELGLATASKIFRNQEHAAPNLMQQMTEAFYQAGITEQDLLNEANSSFFNGNFVQARFYLETAGLSLTPLPPTARFLLEISHVLVNRNGRPETVTVYEFKNLLRLKVESLQWLRRGEQLGMSVRPTVTGGTTAGVMWWNGAAIAVVDIPRSGDYVFRMRAQHNAPAPIEIAMHANLVPIASFSLEREDDSWETLTATTSLASGLNVIGVEFLNDAEINGVNRDAIIDWIELD